MAETPPTGRTTASRRLVVPLAALGAGDLPLAGAKGANLGELAGAGYPVPPGFVVTTDAYPATSTDVAGGEIPDDVRAAILGAYRDHGGGPVAVRSSATAEDLPGATFAGQHDTVLNVIGEGEVLDAVRRCWASLFTDRAVAYRRRRGIGAGDPRMAVVVQSMVDADSAGVMFTANPVTGARDELVVDASSGLGEAVVSGLVTPDRYVLDTRGRIREWTPGRREVVLRAAAGGGLTRETAPLLEARRLPGSVLAELARLGTGVAGHFGRPQDVEWAVAAGRVWLLQARPMTAVPPPPLRLNRIRRMTGRQLVEMLPVRPYPLDMTAWTLPGLGRMVTRMLDEIAGLRVDFTRILPEVDGVVDRLVPPLPRPTRRLLTAPLRNRPRIRRYDPAAWTDDPRFPRFDERVRALAARHPAAMTWEELSGLRRQAVDALDLVTDMRIDYLPRGGASLLRLRLVLWLLGRSGEFRSLIVGAPTRTGDTNRALAALAARVRTDPVLRDLFEELDAATLAERIRGEPRLDDFALALDRFLDEYGHRETSSPLLVSSPTWSEAPAAVLGAVKALAEDRPPAASGGDGGEALRRVLDHPAVRLTRSRARLGRMVVAARAGIALREDTHFHGTRVLPILRGVLLEMGRRLADDGILADRDDVFHLRMEELEALPDPSTAPDVDVRRIQRLVRARSAAREERSEAPLISTAVLFPRTAGAADALLSGIPVGGGRVTGPVRVIRGPGEFGRLRSGDVLVCPYTNPAWTPLFQRAAGVVVDTGGQGSHAAIVAREYGIPAVMGTGTATSSLTDGQVVTVDGDLGRVTATGP